MNLGLIALCIILYILKKPNNFNLGRLIIFSSIMKIIIYFLTLCNISFIVIQIFIVLGILLGLFNANNKLNYSYNLGYNLLVIFTFWLCFYGILDIVLLLPFLVFLDEFWVTEQKYDYLEGIINKMLAKLANYNIPTPGGGGPGPDFDPIIFKAMLNNYGEEELGVESNCPDLYNGLDLRNYKDYIIFNEDIYSISEWRYHLEKINCALDIPSKLKYKNFAVDIPSELIPKIFVSDISPILELKNFKNDLFALDRDHWFGFMGGYLPNGESEDQNIDTLKTHIGKNLKVYRGELDILHKGYLYYLGDKSTENQLCYDFWQKRQLQMRFGPAISECIVKSIEKSPIDTDKLRGKIIDFTKADIYNRELVENLLYILLSLDKNSFLAEFFSKRPEAISEYNNDMSGLRNLDVSWIILATSDWNAEPRCKELADEWLKLNKEHCRINEFTRSGLYEWLTEHYLYNHFTSHESFFILKIIDKITSSPEEHYTSPVKSKFVEHYTGKPINTWKFTEYTGPKTPIHTFESRGFQIEDHSKLGNKPFSGMKTHLTEIGKSSVCKSLVLSSKDIVKHTGAKPTIDTSQLIKGFHIIDHNKLGNKPFSGMKTFISCQGSARS